MANSEKSYMDRLGRWMLLVEVVAKCEPVFQPADDSLTEANLRAFRTVLEGANEAVDALEVDYTVAAGDRRALVKTLRSSATQALGYVKSNKAWATPFRAVKMAADKLRNYHARPRRTGDALSQEKPSRTRGDQAYVELESHLSALIAAVEACPGYAPPGEAIQLATLEAQRTQFRALNELTTQLAGQLTTARETRRRLYDGDEDSLAVKFQAVKQAVKGQYGPQSAACAMARRIHC